MAPNDFQGSVIGGINKRSGIIQNTDMSDDGSGCVIQADVPLAQVRLGVSCSFCRRSRCPCVFPHTTHNLLSSVVVRRNIFLFCCGFAGEESSTSNKTVQENMNMLYHKLPGVPVVGFVLNAQKHEKNMPGFPLFI